MLRSAGYLYLWALLLAVGLTHHVLAAARAQEGRQLKKSSKKYIMGYAWPMNYNKQLPKYMSKGGPIYKGNTKYKGKGGNYKKLSYKGKGMGGYNKKKEASMKKTVFKPGKPSYKGMHKQVFLKPNKGKGHFKMYYKGVIGKPKKGKGYYKMHYKGVIGKGKGKGQPVPRPTMQPTIPTASMPTPRPTVSPTSSPTTSPVTVDPTDSRTALPTSQPTNNPTSRPTSQGETQIPTSISTSIPTSTPTSNPTAQPTATPTSRPTQEDSTPVPTATQTSNPTRTPTSADIVYGLQPDCFVNDPDRLNICLDISSQSGQVESWFPLLIAAKERWERIITEDPWGPWPPNFFVGLRTVATQAPDFEVDDIYIAVVVEDLGIPAFAVAGTQRLTNQQIIASELKIDSADLQTSLDTNIFEDLMIHELAHALGFGTEHEDFGAIAGDRYIGANGLQAWRELGCTGDLPLNAATDRPGDDGHWSESCLQNEVMTPTLRFNNKAIVSAVTLGAMEDLGYTINFGEADPYTLADLGDCGQFCPASARRLGASHASTNPKLSREGEAAILEAATKEFREKRRRAEETTKGGNGMDPFPFVESQSFSILYKENGVYFSRVIHRHQVEHLL